MQQLEIGERSDVEPAGTRRARRARAIPPGSLAGDRGLAVAVVVTGLVAFFGTVALEPAPVAPHASWAWVAEIGGTAFLGLAFLGALALLSGRSRLGYGATTGAAWTMVVLTVGCPVSGHHAFGAWWAGQMALAGMFAVVSTTALAVTRAPRPGRSPR